MSLHHTHAGSGPALLLIHGLGGNGRSFDTIAGELAAQREVIALDLPGFGQSPPLSGDVTIPRLADAVSAFLKEQDLVGVDVVGSSMGARLVMELARRGVVGKAVALDPGGFWTPSQKRFFAISIGVSIRLVKALQPLMPLLTGNPVTRTLLFAQLSARPWKVPAEVLLREMRSYAQAPSTLTALRGLIHGPEQEPAPAGAIAKPLTLVWGKQDKVTFPSQAARATKLFPDAQLILLDRCGHFPHWDRPKETLRLILAHTG